MRMEHLARVRKDNPTVKFEGPDKPKRVLTAEGVVYIANLVDKLKGCNADPESGIGSYCGSPQCRCIEDGERLQAQFGDISPQILADLSKGNWLARILFMFQAFWMIAQCLVRWRSNLSLTLLELQATAHIGIATVRYFIWYHKPIDIVLMTPLSLTEAQYKRMLDELDSTGGITSHYQFKEHHIRDILGDKSSRGLNGLESNTLAGNQTGGITETPKEGMRNGHTEQIMADEKIQGWKWNIDNIHFASLPYFTSQATLGKSLFQQMGGGLPFFKSPFQYVLQATVAFILSYHSGWWLFKVYLWGIICIVYNGINLLAWGWYFPSNFEKIAWRVCAALICATFLCLSIGGCVAHIFHFFVKKKPPSVLYRVTFRIGNMITWIPVLPWMAAKVFIFIESLISLRKLPTDTYVKASWTSFLPHL